MKRHNRVKSGIPTDEATHSVQQPFFRSDAAIQSLKGSINYSDTDTILLLKGTYQWDGFFDFFFTNRFGLGPLHEC